MRHSVLAGVLEVAAANLRHTEDVRLFEIGCVYLPQPGEKLPDEPRRLALVLTGRRQPDFWQDAGAQGQALDFFDLKGVVEALAEDLHLPDVAYRPASTAYLHPGRARNCCCAASRSVASASCTHAPRNPMAWAIGPSWRPNWTWKRSWLRSRAASPIRPVPRFPAALRDIAVIVDTAISSAARRGGDPRGGRRPVSGPAPVRPLPGRQHPGRHEEPGLRPDLPGRRPHPDRQGSGQGPQENRGPAQARAQGPDPRRGVNQVIHAASPLTKGGLGGY